MGMEPQGATVDGMLARLRKLHSMTSEQRKSFFADKLRAAPELSADEARRIMDADGYFDED